MMMLLTSSLLLAPCALGYVAPARVGVARPLSRLQAYVPDGLTPEQWKAMQEKDKAKAKNYGENGPRGYKSRSFNSFVEAFERGEAKHLLPVDPRKVKSGEIPMEDVPYMQRPSGSWDGADLKGDARKRAAAKQAKGEYTMGKWLASDYEYENGGKNKVNSFFGQFAKKQEDVQTRAKKNGISNDDQMWRDAGALSKDKIAKQKATNINAPEKKFFGLF
ncbi:hypothetical protein M885DRAFT_551815 [Pelagophyceae sp. CCMP2097]|nr:hypothetical protein M885DRAFT_551815 [Pelagophyceae sp. CCMP2097]